MSIFRAPKHLTYDESMDWYDRRISICLRAFVISTTISVVAAIVRALIA